MVRAASDSALAMRCVTGSFYTIWLAVALAALVLAWWLAFRIESGFRDQIDTCIDTELAPDVAKQWSDRLTDVLIDQLRRTEDDQSPVVRLTLEALVAKLKTPAGLIPKDIQDQVNSIVTDLHNEIHPVLKQAFEIVGYVMYTSAGAATAGLVFLGTHLALIAGYPLYFIVIAMVRDPRAQMETLFNTPLPEGTASSIEAAVSMMRMLMMLAEIVNVCLGAVLALLQYYVLREIDKVSVLPAPCKFDTDDIFYGAVALATVTGAAALASLFEPWFWRCVLPTQKARRRAAALRAVSEDRDGDI